MNDALVKQYSEAFHLKETLVPFIPEILADIWALGSSPEIILNWLRELNLPAGKKVIDLACGKGAVSITLAAELKFECLGIDFFEPFIMHARKIAEDRELEDSCRFETGDIRFAVKDLPEFDLVCFSSAGSIFGNTKETIRVLRNLAVPGGLILVDDVFLPHSASLPPKGYEQCGDYKKLRLMLESFGDTIINEKIFHPSEMEQMNNRNTALIERRISELSKRHPEHGQDLEDYLTWEKTESKILETEISIGMWLIRKPVLSA